MLYDRVLRNGQASVLAVIVFVIVCVAAKTKAQDNYVLIQATDDVLYMPYSLAEPIPFADIGLLKVTPWTISEELELACIMHDAIDINRAFMLANSSDTVRYNTVGKAMRTSFMHKWYKITIPESVSSQNFAEYLRSSIGIWAESRIHADPDLLEIIVEPTDSLYPTDQKRYWGLNGDGPGFWYRMELPKAWAIHTGSADVRIGIIDTGVDVDHPDLDDRDILTDTGYFHYHGTQVMSQLLAEVNDGEGKMAGINWQAAGNAYWYNRDLDHAQDAATLTEAWADGCQFINCSFKFIDEDTNLVYSALFHEALANMRQAGGIVIASGGNMGDEGSPIQFPAGHQQAVAVSGMNGQGTGGLYSSSGHWIDFTAVGTSVVIPHPWLGYAWATGTSCAAAMVTGVASLLYSYGTEQGYVLDDFDDIYNLFRITADTMEYHAGWNEETGWGLPKLDSAYWMITLPNAITRYEVTDGWTETVVETTMAANGIRGNPYGDYEVTRHELTQWFYYPKDFYYFGGAWVRGRSSISAEAAEPITSAMSGEVLEYDDEKCLIRAIWYDCPYWGQWPLANDIKLVVSLVGEELLNPPTLTVDRDSPDAAAVLHWPDETSSEQGHRVYYQEDGGVWETIELDRNNSSYPFADAWGSTDYSFKVQPWTVHQQNAVSDAVAIKTRPRPPVDVSGTVLMIDPDQVPLGKPTAGEPELEKTNCVIVQSEISLLQPDNTLEKRFVRFRDGTTYQYCWPCPPPTYECCEERLSTWYADISENGVDTVQLETNTTYTMVVFAIDVYGDTSVVGDVVEFTTGNYPYTGTTVIPVCEKTGSPAGVPESHILAQNYPNPFNVSTSISFSLAHDSHVDLEVYDILGRSVRQLIGEVLPAGPHSYRWDGLDDRGNTVASGVYLYRLTTPEFSDSKKMLLMK